MTPKQSLAEVWASALRPDAVITADEWARTERVMPADGVEPGPYRPERTPYMIDPQRTMSPTSTYTEGWMKKGTQLGGSVSGENMIGCWICTGAGNILVSFPKIEDAKQWELSRFEPMRISSRALRKRVRSSSTKGADNTKLRKKYPGGVMRLIGVSAMPKSATVRYVKVEEADEYPVDVKNQGSVFDGLRARIRNFGRKAKMFGDSSPTVEGASHIDREYKRGDQRKWHLCCPDCGHAQPLNWAQMKWVKHEDPEQTAASTRYACEACGSLNDEAAWKVKSYARRPGMSEAECKAEGFAYWEATAKGQPGVASWHIGSIAAPLGWAPWGSLVLMYLSIGDDEDKKKAFDNNVKGEVYSYKQGAAVSAKSLQALAENYPLMSCPMGGLIVVCGVDTQDNRLAYVIRAYGRHEESWGIAHGEIYGDTTQPEVWKKLADMLDAPIVHASGQTIHIDVAFIDMGGHRGEYVKAFCRDAALRGKHWCASMGAKLLTAPPLGKPRKVEFTWRGKEVPGGAEFRYVGTQAIKNLLDGRLKLATAPGDARSGPGVFHTPLGFEEDYYKQLRSEQRIMQKDKSGNKLLMWIHVTGRNEAWDCEVLAYAAYLYAMQGRHADTFFKQREKIFADQRQGDLLAQPSNPATPTQPEASAVVQTPAQPIVTTQQRPLVVAASSIPRNKRPGASWAKKW